MEGCEKYVCSGSSDCRVYDSGKCAISRFLPDGDFYRTSLSGMRYDKSVVLSGNRKYFCLCADASLGALGVCLFLYYAWNRYIIGRDAKGMNMLIGITFAMLIICYVWRMFLYFPDKAPCVYRKRNVLAGIMPFYEQILHELHIL